MKENIRPDADATCPVCRQPIWNDTAFVEVHTKRWDRSSWVHLICLDKLKKSLAS